MPLGPHAACRACKHPQRPHIDEDCWTGVGLEEMARKYGLSVSGLSRHRANHAGKRRPNPAETKSDTLTQAEDSLSRLERLLQSVTSVLERAKDSGSLSVSVSAIREAREVVESISRLKGELKELKSGNGSFAKDEAMVKYLLSFYPHDLILAIAREKPPQDLAEIEGEIHDAVRAKLREKFDWEWPETARRFSLASMAKAETLVG